MTLKARLDRLEARYQAITEIPLSAEAGAAVRRVLDCLAEDLDAILPANVASDAARHGLDPERVRAIVRRLDAEY